MENEIQDLSYTQRVRSRRAVREEDSALFGSVELPVTSFVDVTGAWLTEVQTTIPSWTATPQCYWNQQYYLSVSRLTNSRWKPARHRSEDFSNDPVVGVACRDANLGETRVRHIPSESVKIKYLKQQVAASGSIVASIGRIPKAERL
ncbi:hypothetical protein BV898_01113 [Hypsibius exemplaris]|uniref:Uncharacterized protein n=1 Tax=Hypsibius exemplaris TaxID=2072580 RepID=A0A1W0XD85_HYPEX|nr:hypothetical protein BV898_01113 [Hypsibius exemplaris]